MRLSLGAVLATVAALTLWADAPRAQAPKAAAPAAPAATPATPGGTLGLAGGDSSKPVAVSADNGIEWQQTNHVYIARGNAKATRGDTTVNADTLYAYYRQGAPPPPADAAAPQLRGNPPPGPAASASPLDTGSSQIYRIEAEGHVVFTTPTQTAIGDHAVYDMDQAVMVLTGKALKITTPQDVVTARDSFEWYDQKQLGVARGDALAVRAGPPQKSIRGDVLTTLIVKTGDQPSKISRIDAQGHVLLISRDASTQQDQIAHGDTAVYNMETGIATLSGHVTLTRGENELRGQYGVVDTNSNVARLLAAPPNAQLTGPRPRVEGLFMPQTQPAQTDGAAPVRKP